MGSADHVSAVGKGKGVQDCKVAAGCWKRRAGDCMVEETKETSVRIRNERGVKGVIC